MNNKEKKTANTGKIHIVGTGPGAISQLTGYGRKVIEESGIIIGYKKYIEMIREIISDKTIISSGMGDEIERARKAIDLAQEGNIVSLISGGDAGIYGMAGPIFEVLKNMGLPADQFPAIEIIPGITGLNAAASLLGAPIMHDFASISLSDLLTPWEKIETRLHKAAEGDFVIILYNPKSKGRSWQMEEAVKIIRKFRPDSTPAGIVENAYREGEKIIITNLSQLGEHEIGMQSIIIIGNSRTFVLDKFIITPRGYVL